MSADGYSDIALDLIEEPAHQLRERIDPERLGALADSIATEGLHQPIGVRGPLGNGRYEIVWGHRRYLAVRSLGWRAVPARVFPPDYDPLLAAVSENLNREALNPVEEALAVKQFVERGTSRAEIARLFRRSLTWVDQRVALLDMPADVQEAIREHGLPLTVANALADIDHEQYRRQLLYEAVAHGATASSALVWRQHYLADRDRIVRNDLAIEQIITEREKYVVRYPCDWCKQEEPYTNTRTMRLCADCMREFLDAREEAPKG